MTYKLSNFREVHEVLSKHVPPLRSFRGAYTLERMQKLMAELGNPQDTYRTIHVAGTSGKTSTSYYLTSLLKAAGQKVGLTISPHIDEVNERVQINLQPLTEKKFCQEFSVFLNIVEKTNIKPTYFELLVAFAFWHFAREKVDYAVIEVGLGGLLDGTNVMNRGDKVCVITDIGLDHTAVLGESIAAITAQKAGIIQPHNTVFSYEQGDVVMEVLREVSTQLQAELHEVWPLKPSELPKQMPLYQRRNWYLALITYDYLSKRDNLPELDESQLATTTMTHIPARMEILQVNGKTLVLDGAHNSQKMKALVSSMKQHFKHKTFAVLFSLVQSRNYRTLSTLREVASLADYLIITQFDVQQDLRKLSVDSVKVAKYCEQLEFKDFEIITQPEEALAQLLKRKEDVLLITGSFYLLNHIRPVLWKYDPTHSSHRS
jgi:dihydrofolate synthase / folylpolyglutamate synthase